MTPEERLAEAVRAKGYIDIVRSDDLSQWLEEVIQPVIAVMREQGWTVTAPETRTHSLEDLSQDTSGMWWWACGCGATCDDAVLSAMESANGYLDHLAESGPDERGR